MTYRTTTRRRTIRADRTSNAAHAIGPVEPGMDLFLLTHGQFSLLDAIVYLSTQTDTCDLTVSTWTAGAEDLSHMADLLAAGKFRRVRWLVDRSFITRQPNYCARLRTLFGDEAIRTTRSHAKFVIMRNDKYNLAIRTSMNLNHNARSENLEISDDPSLADFLEAEVARYFDAHETGVFDGELIKNPPTITAGTVTARRIYGDQ